VLDEVLNELDERDRAAILLRFFENRPFAEVGLKLRLTENAARMRVERALAKLHALLARRGVTSTTAALSLVLATQAAAAAPAGLAATVTGVALVAGTSTGVGFAAVFMSSIKLQLGVTAAILAAGTLGVVVQSRANAGWRDEIAAWRPQTSSLAGLRQENERLSRAAAEVAMLRQDDAELARLQDQVVAVKARQEQAARAETAARAARAAAFAALPVYTPDQLDQQPTPTYQARPNYPLEARRSGTSGQAVVSFVVNPAGEVSDVQAASSTQPDFATAAVAAVQQWQFKPGQKAGQPVNARMQIPIVFTLNNDDELEPAAPANAFTIEQSHPAAQTEPPLDSVWF
jgi:TonB family protein